MSAPGIDICSSVPLYLEAYFRDLLIGGATGFLWVRPNRELALVTNWHVASGRNNETNECMDKMGAVPDRLRVQVPQNDRALPPLIIDVETIGYDGEPLWTEHPKHGRSVDVVALPIKVPPIGVVDIMPMNAIKAVPLKQRIGLPMFILGYPFGRLGIGMPIWKQATFASEPFLSPDLDHRFLIVDTASRPGMSGSPVIQRSHGQIELEGQYGRTESGDGAMRFVGVYSGRFHTNDANDAQLGRVWPARLVVEIVENMTASENRRAEC